MRKNLVVLFTIAGTVVCLGAPSSRGATKDRPAASGPGFLGFSIAWRAGAAPTVTPITTTAPSLAALPAGMSGCNVMLQTYPIKSGTDVDEKAYDSCSGDVYHLEGTLDLYRGLPPGLIIASDHETDDINYIDWDARAPCQSTYAYWASLEYVYSCSTINGCIQTGPYQSDVHYWSC